MTGDQTESEETALGLESGVVRVVAHRPVWAGLYAAEAARLSAALASSGCSLILEHSGSTAVPELAAKPIIDMIAGRSAESDRERIIEAIVAAGYDYRGEQGIVGRDFFRRGKPRSYHLHLCVVGSEFWNDHRAFRDALLASPETAAAYARLKLDLAREFPRDRERYTDGKTEFVRMVLARLGKSTRRGSM